MIAPLLSALVLQAAVADVGAKAAETVRRYDANASQGAAVGPNDVYTVRNFELIRFDKKTGQEKARWTGDKARFPHINSCAVIAKDLVCASSNYPSSPHVSTVEFFDPVTLAHRKSGSLGLGTGSITWGDRHDGAWWAMFANYDKNGAEAPRDHTWTTLVKFDDQWRKLEGWALPKTILDRIAPMRVSAGGFGLIILATAMGPLGAISALRETSVVFAALLGWLFLKERFSPRRIAACAVVAVGAGLVALA